MRCQNLKNSSNKKALQQIVVFNLLRNIKPVLDPSCIIKNNSLDIKYSFRPFLSSLNDTSNATIERVMTVWRFLCNHIFRFLNLRDYVKSSLLLPCLGFASNKDV